MTNKRGHLIWSELHTFSDASTVGYGACSHLRCVYGDGSIEVNFVMGKSRVTPIKFIGVPRLGLVAAVLGAKLNAKICNELDLIVNRVYYWTNAVVVLRYIHNTSTRFEVFIANRLNVLHALTSVDQWKRIPGQGRIKAGADGAAAPGPPTKIGLSITTYYEQLSDFFINQLFYFKVEYELPIFIGLIYPV